jgi:hypothetical protein
MKKMYKLLTPQGPVQSETPGELGGHKGGKIYGRMDCAAANRALSKNGGLTYKKNRVFFKDEATAIACGFRPCGVCLKAKYDVWKELQLKKS